MIYKRDIAPALSDRSGTGYTDNSSSKLSLMHGGRVPSARESENQTSNPQAPEYQPGKHVQL